MNKKLLIALLTTLTAGSIIQAEVSSNDTENHGFLASLGIGVKDIVESPAHIGQGGKKKSKKSKSETESTEQQSKKKQTRRQRRRSDNSNISSSNNG